MAKKRIQAKDLLDKIEKITKERMTQEKVISFDELKRVRQKKEPWSLLLIEDDETLRKAMKRIFEDEGCDVIAVSDGTQLNQVLDGALVDLIVLDIGLPWMNGFELAELLKNHEDLKWIPILVVSGRSSHEDVKKAFDLGVDDYVTKPFEIDHLKKVVSTLLNLNS